MPSNAQSQRSGLVPASAGVQPYGSLMVLDTDSLQIRHVSANLEGISGTPVAAALAGELADVVGQEAAKKVHRLGRQGATAALVVKRVVAGKHRSLQLSIRPSKAGLLLELEPLKKDGNRRLLATVNVWLQRLAEAGHPDELLNALVQGVATLTGHDRVLICAFDADGHGAVLTEHRSAEVHSLNGMRFPASDFPPHLRELYERMPMRYVPDIHAKPLPLTPATATIDLSETQLRAISQEQFRYLDALDISALLAMAMHGDAGLWGLVICHHSRAHRVSPAVRDAAFSLVQMATQRLFLLKARIEARFLQRVQESRELLNTQQGDLPAPHLLVARHGEVWLELFRAQCVVLVTQDRRGSFGSVPPDADLEQLVDRLRRKHRHPGPWVSHALLDESLTEGLDLGNACGLLAAPLPNETQQSWLLFFRPEQRETHLWAGMPNATQPLVNAPSTTLLGKMFNAWEEEVNGQSAPWERIERLAAMALAEDLAIMASAQQIQHLNASLHEERKALAEANDRLQRMAHYDPLTQVWNRYRIEQALDAELNAAVRYGRPLSVILYDVDHFKSINDDFGHDVGDRVLSCLASTIRAALRESDHLARWGGEEFLILAANTDHDAALGMAERLRGIIEAIHVSSFPRQVTASLGVASWQEGDTRKSLITRADAAMYRAKAEGRNRVSSAI